MTTVVPKILHQHGHDLAVWEIKPLKGPRIYYERKSYTGYIPIGCREVCTFNRKTLLICDVVKTFQGDKIPVFKVAQGYLAQPSWYEPDPNYKGSVSTHPLSKPVEVEDPGYVSAEEY